MMRASPFARPRLLLAACAAVLCACAGPDVTQYAAERPALDLAGYFQGRTEAWGMFQGRGGEVVRRFRVQIDGRVENAELVLDEHFTYSDGTTQERIWTLARTGPDTWRGRAADVVGDAVGTTAGDALRWRYTLRLPVQGRSYDVQFDDWMFRIDQDTVVNRARMSKFGVELGQVTLFFRHSG